MNGSLLVCDQSLSDNLVEGYAGCHAYIETFNMAQHGDFYQGVTDLPGESSESFALSSHHDPDCPG